MSTSFENAIHKALAVDVRPAGITSNEARPKFNRREGREAEASILLREAFARLKASPELRRLAPDGRVAYSDPILTAAADFGEIAADIGFAGVEGADLKNSTIWKWAVVAVKAWLNRRDKGMSDLAARVPTRSIRLNSPARIAVVGDAGYRGVVQDAVIDMIEREHRERRFDFLVHLGDVYFSAGGNEMLHNLLAPFSRLGIPWATLCGNHDLYHGPDAYMSALDVLDQPGRYFLIENEHWKIAALDTSFAAKDIARGQGELNRTQLTWLKDLTRESGSRKTVLMSHHFILSGWDEPSAPLARQVSQLARENVFAWYWGHEHRCALYDRGSWGFFGASVGHGAFLEKFSNATRDAHRPVWHSGAALCCCTDEKKTFWPHGFVELEFRRDALVETSHLEGGVKEERVLKASAT